MSHIVKIKSKVTCLEAIRAASRRIGAEYLGEKTHEMYGGQVAAGHGVQLKEWRHPVVFDKAGECSFDNFGGRWGKQSELDSFLQAYAVEKTKIEARRKGFTCTEQKQPNGTIRVVLNAR